MKTDAISLQYVLLQKEKCCKMLSLAMKKEVTDTVIVTVDCRRRNDINHRQFVNFLKEVVSECNDFICYSVARRLRRGAVLITFFFLI